jgi:hypothetical protein
LKSFAARGAAAAVTLSRTPRRLARAPSVVRASVVPRRHARHDS